MAKRFLTDINLAGNQLINATFEKLSADPTTGNFEGRIYYNTALDILKLYDGTAWIAVGAITDIQGTADEVSVSISDGVATISLPTTINANTTGSAAKLTTTRAIELSGDVTGTANFDGSAAINISTTIAANSVALGTDTTGNYVADLAAGTGISVSGGGSETSTVTVTNTGVTALAGTANQITASGSTGSVTLSLPNAVTFPGTVTLNADPTNDLHAATKQYVDAVAQGLHVHASVETATTVNIADFDNPPVAIDGVTLVNQMRVLVKNQSTQSENGIYVYDLSTTALVRASDFNSSIEIQGGDFLFVTGGSTYDNTGWVQTEKVNTVGTDPISFAQFSGAGTYSAGNGLTLTGNSFSINTGVTADLSTAQTLTNKTLTNPTISGLYLSDNTIIVEGTTDSFETTVNFSDPTADRTITFQDATGTVAFTGDITTAIDAITTTVIEEGTNLYYTDTRVNNILSTGAYTKKISANVGNATNTSFAITHGLGTRDVQVQVYDNATYDTVEIDVIRTDVNTVTVSFASAPALNAYRVVIIG
jgi:hypothetical protein